MGGAGGTAGAGGSGGAGGVGGEGGVGGSGGAGPVAQVRIAQLLAAGTVDFSVDGTDYAVNVPAGSATAWFDVPAGTSNGLIEVTAGLTFNVPLALDLLADQAYTVVVYGGGSPHAVV
jgi:hypothetical protein